jgi:hypothetical protein
VIGPEPQALELHAQKVRTHKLDIYHMRKITFEPGSEWSEGEVEEGSMERWRVMK